MKCDECHTEMMIDKTFYTYRNGKLVCVQEMSCHNKECPNSGEKKEIVHPVPTE